MQYHIQTHFLCRLRWLLSRNVVQFGYFLYSGAVCYIFLIFYVFACKVVFRTIWQSTITHIYACMHKHLQKNVGVFFLCVHISLLVSGNALTHVIHDNKDVELIHANPARCKAKKCCYANREISFQIAAANTGSDLKGKSCICVHVCWGRSVALLQRWWR